MSTKLKKFAVFGLAGTIGGSLSWYLLLKENKGGPWPTVNAEVHASKANLNLPCRSDLIKSLKSEKFDVLVIGGGASGVGCALDATTRGLKTALVEAEDYASGTSSKSTKLIHGGVRYLQAAITRLDREQYNMVKESLGERRTVINQAPYLAHPVPIILPVYQMWQVPYFWFGLKMYDAVAGSQTLKMCYYLSKQNALELFPMLRKDTLCGGIVYYDGMMDDARLNLVIAMTALQHGATVVNHASVTRLIKGKVNGREVITGAQVKDEINGETINVSAKCVINATGPFTDSIRKMDEPNARNICSPSSGVHITLPGYYCAGTMGLLDPETSDGRIIFFLPWQNHTIVGTTDAPCDVTRHPKPKEEEISFILNEIKHYLSPEMDVRRGDVLSAWSGIRPLVSDPNRPDTKSLARNHIVHVSDSRLVTVAGGKWTTYRSMASDTVDAAVKACKLSPKFDKCQTKYVNLIGTKNWSPTAYIRLVQDFGMDPEAAQHLSGSYGNQASVVAGLASSTGKRWPIIGNKLHPDFPYIDAEIRYAVRTEYALTSIDMIARRFRLAFLNVNAAQEALQGIVDIMAEELKWSADEKQRQIKMAQDFLQNDMGQSAIRETRAMHESCRRGPAKLSNNERNMYIKRFELIDRENKGFISINDIRSNLKNLGEKEITCDELHEILAGIDTNTNGQVELEEYLQIMTAVKIGCAEFAQYMKIDEIRETTNRGQKFKKKIPVERSCGGV